MSCSFFLVSLAAGFGPLVPFYHIRLTD
jgi:hypothetical protein